MPSDRQLPQFHQPHVPPDPRRSPLSCTSHSRPRSHAQVRPPGAESVPAPFPVLSPQDVLDVLAESRVLPMPPDQHHCAAWLVLCDAASEVMAVVAVDHAPPDAAVELAAVLSAALDIPSDDEGRYCVFCALSENPGTDVASVIVVLARGASAPFPDAAELGTWVGFEDHMAGLAVEVPDVMVITPSAWSSVSLDRGSGWYDGTPLRELLGEDEHPPGSSGRH